VSLCSLTLCIRAREQASEMYKN